MHAPARPMLLLGTAFLLLAAGCSEDDDDPTGNGDTNPDTQTANTIVYEIMMPVLQDLALADYVGQAPPPEPGKKACATLDLCLSGSVEVCTEIGSLIITFSQCELPGGVVDGALSFTTTGSTGSGTIQLSYGNSTLNGAMSFSSDETCFGQTFGEVTVVTPSRTVIMSGGIGWCEPLFIVDGELYPTSAFMEFSIPSLNRVADVVINTEPAGQVDVTILNSSRTTIHRVCSGDITRSTLSCSDG